MIVTCARCLKRYMLDDILVPQEGRQVRCISCHHVWRQVPESPSFLNSPPFFELSRVDGLAEGPSFSKKRFPRVALILGLSLLMSLLSCLIFGRHIIVTLWPAGEKYLDLFLG